METSGRRPLLLGGMAVMIIANSLITIALNLQEVEWMAYISILCTIAFVIGFSIGLGNLIVSSWKMVMFMIYVMFL